MRKILGLILLIISVNAIGQDPTGYQHRIVRERIQGSFMVDSTLHIPRYCGTPSGVRGGGSIQDGALAVDTCNNILYYYSSAAWIAVGTTNIYNSNGILNSNRTLTGLNNTYPLNFDSLSSWRVGRNGVSRFSFNSTTSSMVSQNTNAAFTANPSNAIINYTGNAIRVFADSSTSTKIISYEVGFKNGMLTDYALTPKGYVDSLHAAGGATPGIDDVLSVNQSLTTNRAINAGSNSLKVNGLGNLPILVLADPGSGSIILGRAVSNGTYISLDSASTVISAQAQNGAYWELDGTSKLYHVVLDGGRNFLNLDASSYIFSMGDISGGGGNHSYLEINDAAQTWKATKIPSGAGTKAIRYNPSTGALTYADTTSGGSGSGTLSRIGTLDSLVKVANGMQVSGVSIIPQTSDSTYAGLLKNTDYNRSFKYKVQYNPTGTITHNQDSCGQEQFYFTSTGGRTLAFSGLRRGDITVLTFNNSSGSQITLTLPSNAYVNYASAATATIPTGESALNLYIYDGTNYRFIQSSASAGTAAGSAKQVQYNNSGATDGAAGFEYQSGASPNVLIQAQNAAYSALVVKAAGSQSTDIMQIQNSSAGKLIRVDAGGGLRIEGTLSAPAGAAANEIGVIAGAAYYQGYDRGGGSYTTTYLDGFTRINYSGTTKITTGVPGAFISNATGVPTARLHIGAGTTAASTASIKIDAGALQTTIEPLTTEANASSIYNSTVALNRYATGGAIKDFITTVDNSGTGETDLYTYTTKANTLVADGEKLIFEISGTFNDLTATAQLQFYFGGTNIGNTGALTVSATGGWSARIIVIRTGSTTARTLVTVTTPGASTALYTTQTDVTGLTLSSTNIIKVTGTAGGATGGSADISAKMGTIFWYGAANN